MSESDLDLVPVMQYGDVVALHLAKSVLQSNDIPCAVHGEHLQDLFGWGRIGFQSNPMAGRAQLVVRRSDADRAKELLAGVVELGDPGVDDGDPGEPEAGDA